MGLYSVRGNYVTQKTTTSTDDRTDFESLVLEQGSKLTPWLNHHLFDRRDVLYPFGKGVRMELISGKEALIALANGEEVEFKHDAQGWVTCLGLNIEQVIFGMFQLRIKPRTINLNGIEVPAPFEPELEDRFFYIDANYPDGFNYGFWGGSLEEKCRSQFGAWRTEEEIKQVVDALRKVLKEPQQ